MRYMSRALLLAGGVLALGAGIGLYAYLEAHLGGLEAERRRIEKTRLFDFDPGAVLGGEVTAKGETVRFVRTPRGHSIVTPIDAPADEAVVGQLIGEVTGLRTESMLDLTPEEVAASRRTYGLDTPSVRVRLDLAGGRTAELRVGHKNDFDGRYYVESVERHMIGLADPRFLPAIQRDLHALREKRLLSVREPDLLRLETRRGDVELHRLERNGATWDVASGPRAAADPVEAVRLIEAIVGLRAKRYADDSGSGDPNLLARWGLEPPAYRVALVLKNGIETTLRLGSATGEDGITRWYVRVDGRRSIAEIEDTFYKELERTSLDLLDRRVLEIDEQSVGRIRIERGSEIVEIERDARGSGDTETWRIRSAQSRRAKTWKVSALLYALSHLRGTRVDTTRPDPKDLRRTGLAPARTTIVLSAQDGREIATLLVGRETPARAEELFVMAKGGARIDVVEASKIALPTRLDELADPMEPGAERPEAGASSP